MYLFFFVDVFSPSQGTVMFYVFLAVVRSDGVHGYGTVEYSYVSLSV